MGITTFSGFVTALGNITVTGVKQKLTAPPASLGAVDLPAQWVQLPSAEEGPITYQTHGGWPTFKAQFVIAYKGTMQDEQKPNWANTLEMVDNTMTALRGVASGTIGKGPLEWSIHPGVVTVGNVEYWAVIAEVTAHG